LAQNARGSVLSIAKMVIAIMSTEIVFIDVIQVMKEISVKKVSF
jgi:hypothetical protein